MKVMHATLFVPPWMRYSVAIPFVALAFLIKFTVQAHLSTISPFQFFGIAVVLSAYFGGRGAAILATVLSALLGYFFFLEPTYTAVYKGTVNTMRILLFLIEGFTIAYISGVLRNTLKASLNLQEQYQESEKRFRTLTDTAPVFIWESDATRKNIYFNKGWLDFRGRTLEEEKGTGWLEGIHPDDRKRVENVVADIYVTHRPFSIEFRLKRYDGAYRWIIDSGIPRFTETGSFYGYIGSCIDITNEKNYAARLEQVADEVKREKQKLMSTVNSVPGVVWEAVSHELGKTLQVTFVSDYAKTMLGYDRSEWLEKPNFWLDIMHPADRPIALAEVERMFRTGTSGIIQFRWIAKNNKDEFWVETHLVIIKNNKETPTAEILAVTTDISHTKELDRRKNEFISLTSHELKTPLTTIKAYAQLLLQYATHQEDKKSGLYLSKMDTQIGYLTKLIETLLDASRTTNGRIKLEKEMINVDNFLEEVIADMQASNKRHRLIITRKINTSIFADPYRLSQVLTNLVTNASKYSPNTSDIIITPLVQDNELIVKIQDFGIGIPSDQQQSIFQRFFRVEDNKRSSFPGLGLGLYISKNIIEQHSGKIWFESEEDKGSTFFFSIPLSVKQQLMDSLNTYAINQRYH